MPETPGTKIGEFTIRICRDCYDLKGAMCHNSECIFCRRTMAEVGEALDMLLIRPLVDGERIDAQSFARCDGNHEMPRCADPECWQGAEAGARGQYYAVIERCEGHYPVPHKRDEPFEVTYRCARPKGHDGPHGNTKLQDVGDEADDEYFRSGTRYPGQ